ncbi:MAG: leucine--tRNA ligase [Deltaproteobacteria bacterium]|nr:leucine--tRNA ligase [Deltaproteobacteria bacterium]
MPYRPTVIEPKWQEFWEERGTFVAKEDRSKPKFYALDMFPYPSGKGLHVGHPAGYTASDVVCRHKRANGFNVLHPMGYDSFGLPAEQKAIDEGIAPQVSTAQAIATFRAQLKSLGMSYDWTREISTAEPSYYKWTQWIFTKLYERGLAYQGDMFVNWCAALGTVLANDEVIDGKSERGGHPVERKQMRQWMLKITQFAERLLQGHEHIDWPDATKKRQKEWIGKSEGAHVTFAIKGSQKTIQVFTTRPDTIFGATYMVLAPEHALVDEISANRAPVQEYKKKVASKSDVDRQEAKEKTGADTGAKAINPATGQEIPIWIADYVLMGYGTGAIMAVPAHDERDYAFAKTFGLPIKEVITGGDVAKEAYAGEGAMTNSAHFDGTKTDGGEAKKKVTQWLEEKGVGKGATTFRLRDWVFARQRYWGEPIPILKTKSGEVSRTLRVDELPLVLPEVKDYKPRGTGESPLAGAKDWVTQGELVRETDTMPGSAGSSWYFLRYCDPHNDQELCAREKSDYWMPVDLYVGGPEHTVGHLMYARMWQMFLKDIGVVRDEEPFKALRHQGMIQGEVYYDSQKRIVQWSDVETKGDKFFKKGTSEELVRKIEKMSKRKGNVVNPTEIIKDYGADALRVYICFMGPLEADKPWQTNGLEGQHSWLKRVWRLYFEGDEDTPRADDSPPSDAALKIVHKTIKKVSADIPSLNLNTAISALHVATRDLLEEGTKSRAVLEPLAQLLAPFAPHLAEELWEKALGKPAGISYVAWPKHDDRYAVDDTVAIAVQVNGKLRGEVQVPKDSEEAPVLAAAKALASVNAHLEGKTMKRVVYVKNRLLNLVVA